MVRVVGGDAAFLAQAGEAAADGFHGQAQVIGDVGARHRQDDFGVVLALATTALRHVDQEAGQPLHRIQAGQRHQVAAGGVQLDAGAFQQFALQLRVVVAQAAHVGHRELAQGAVGDGFDGVLVVRGARKTDEVARHQEAGHQPAPVGQQADAAQRALGHREHAAPGFAFAHQRFAGHQADIVGQRFHRMRLLHRQGGAHGQVPDQAATAAARDLAHHAIAGRGGHRGVVKAEDAKAHGGRLRGSSAAMIRPRVTYLPAATIGRGPGAFRRRSPIQARIRLQCAPLACGRSFPRWSAGAGNPLWFPAPAPLRLLSLRKLGRAVLAPPHPFSQRGFRERFESRPVPHSACMRRHTRVWRRRTRPVGRHWSLTHDV